MNRLELAHINSVLSGRGIRMCTHLSDSAAATFARVVEVASQLRGRNEPLQCRPLAGQGSTPMRVHLLVGVRDELFVDVEIAPSNGAEPTTCVAALSDLERALGIHIRVPVGDPLPQLAEDGPAANDDTWAEFGPLRLQ